jgi:hypothetical protein
MTQANRNTAGNRQLAVPSSGVSRAVPSASSRRCVHRRRATHPIGLCSQSVLSAGRRPTLRPRESCPRNRANGRPEAMRTGSSGGPSRCGTRQARQTATSDSNGCASQAQRRSSIQDYTVYSQAGAEMRRSITKRDRSPDRACLCTVAWALMLPKRGLQTILMAPVFR